MNVQNKSLYGRIVQILIFTLAAFWLTSCQEEPKTYTIGVVNFSPTVDPVFDGFKAGLAEKGYLEGQNVTYIYEGAVGSIAALDPAIQNLLRQDVDLILSITTPAAQKAMAATQTSQTPVIFGLVTNPVSSGIVDSLTKPGTNLTGVQNGGSIAKELDYLRQIAPNTQWLYVLHNPNDDGSQQGLLELQAAAEILALHLNIVETTNDEEFETAITTIPADTDAIFMLPSGFFSARAEQFAQTGITYQIPVVSVPPQTTVGILMSYGPVYYSIGFQLSRLADQILRGTAPGDLPVEMPEYFLEINLATAKTIGVEIPEVVLAQADQITR